MWILLCKFAKKIQPMKFTKMHGAGNDYVYVDGFVEKIEQPEALAIRLSDRHKGIGSDGLVLILPSETCDFRMRMFNADGSEAQMCGNASRCVGKYVYDKGYTDKRTIRLETLAGVKALELFPVGGRVETVKVDMGEPILSTREIPVLWPEERLINRVVDFGQLQLPVTAVSMGNPHAVIFLDEDVPNFKSYPIESLGKLIENHPLFPEKTNVEFVEILSPTHANMRVWERGSGETQACGTGACATLVAAVLNRKLERKARISLLGGELDIEWNAGDNHVFMTGPATNVFDGEIEL
jgi:diaminopimelate epimerase